METKVSASDSRAMPLSHTDTLQQAKAEAAAAKATEVFETVELLEAILLQVDDERTVLFSQRVNKTFQNTITGSIKLQQALWLRPKSSTTDSDKFEVNPILFEKPEPAHEERLCRFSPIQVKDFVPSDWWRAKTDGSSPDLSFILDKSILEAEPGSWRDMPVARNYADGFWVNLIYCGSYEDRRGEIITEQCRTRFKTKPVVVTAGELMDYIKRFVPWWENDYLYT